ncbi:MAG: ATP/GTP-binding protein [Rhodothermia bacterium]
MIRSLSFENFFSFRGKTTLDFTVGKQAPQTNLFAPTPTGDRVAKAIALIGANGSGKTNILRAFVFMRWFAVESFRNLEPNEDIPFVPYQFRDEEKPTHFRLEFELGEDHYAYSLSLTREKVLSERLELLNRVSQRFRYLVVREETGSGEYELRSQDFELNDRAMGSILRSNASIISTGRYTDHPGLAAIGEYLRSSVSNIDLPGRFLMKDRIIDAAGRYASQSRLREDASDILRDLDLGLHSFEIETRSLRFEDDQEQAEVHIPLGIHRVNGQNYRLPFIFESGGTRSLFVLLSELLTVLDRGGLAVIDEFEADLHPHMIPRILQLFFDPDTNPHSAQLLFSCHSTNVLESLEKDQIVLVQKNSACESRAWRLDEVSNVRRDENLYAKYNAGAYGAVPVL